MFQSLYKNKRPYLYILGFSHESYLLMQVSQQNLRIEYQLYDDCPLLYLLWKKMSLTHFDHVFDR